MAGHANHAANAAAWAAMRAEQAAAMEQRREQRRAEKAARRAANRAAWWARYGLEAPDASSVAVVDAAPAPEPEPFELETPAAVPVDYTPDMLFEFCPAVDTHLRGFTVNVPSDGMGRVVTYRRDGVGYAIEKDAERGYVVYVPGVDPLEVPTFDDGKELIAMAAETLREESDAIAAFTVGMVAHVGGTVARVTHVTGSAVELEITAGSVTVGKSLPIRRGPRGQHVVINGKGKAARAIYAADLAA